MRESVHGKVQIFSVESDLTKGIRPLRFRFNSFRPEDYFSILRISEAAHKQRALLRRVLRDLQGTTWDLDDLRTALSRTGDDTEALEQSSSIIDRIDGTTEFVVFDKTEEVPLRGTPGLLTKGCMTVLALAGLDTDVQQAIVRHVCQIIFRAAVRWKRKEDGEKTPGPVLIVVEEAHNFVPSKQTASSSRILTKIASEGRKFGVGLCIISQRPGKVDSDALSQCNSMIILRIVNPHDQKQIELSAEAMSRDLMDELPGLNVGEAIIFGPAINLPGLVKVDKYEGTLGGEDLDIVSLWSEADQSEDQIVRQYDDSDSAYRRKRK
jgi:hypothetical protein